MNSSTVSEIVLFRDKAIKFNFDLLFGSRKRLTLVFIKNNNRTMEQCCQVDVLKVGVVVIVAN